MKPFFDAIRAAIFAGNLSQSQVDGFNILLAAWLTYGDGDSGKLAYVLATALHETASTMRPIIEYGGDAYLKAKPYYPYVGRGYVQLTWKDGYQRVGTLIGVDLVNQPGLALDPQIAAKIIVKGMLSGWFTGRKLSDYITPSKADFIAARAIVNGSDRAGLIAGYALVFLEALKAASAEAPMAPEPGTPFPQHLPPQPPTAPSAPVGGKIIIPPPTARKFDLWAMLAELFAAIVKLFNRKV